MCARHKGPTIFAVCVALALTPGYASAQQNQSDVIQLDKIVVDKAGLVEETEGAIEITREDLDRAQATTLGDVFRYAPGIEGLAGPGRQFGDVNIRGIDGAGAVIIAIDGAEKNLVETKHGIEFNPIFLNPDFLKSVTIVKGPVSNVYGTGSIGGRVEFRTVDPSDFLAVGKAFGGATTLGGVSNGPGYHASAIGAARLGKGGEILGGLSYRRFHDYRDGDDLEVLNSGSEITGILSKIVLRPADGLTVEASYNRTGNEYVGSNVYGRANFRQDADFENDVVDSSLTASAEYKPASLTWLSFDADLFYSTTVHEETLVEKRAGSRSLPGDRDKRDGVSRGGTLFATLRGTTGPLRHKAAIGGSLTKDVLKYERVPGTDTEDAGTPPETNGDRLVYGFFAQNRIIYGDGLLEVIPGVRYERYDVETDQGAETSGGELLPKVTLALRPLIRASLKGLQLYGSWARGLRAPRLTELTIDRQSERTRTLNGVTTTTITRDLANPDLEAEFAHNVEIGARYKGRGVVESDDAMTLTVSLFRNNIKNKIERVTLSQVPHETLESTTVTTRQIRNVGSARIQGIEISASYDARRFFFGATAEKTKGKNKETGAPLNSVRPTSATLYGGMRFLDYALTVGSEIEMAQGKTETGENLGVIGDSTKGYTLVNLFSSYRLSDSVSLNARIDNLFDVVYRRFDHIDNGEGISGRLSLTARF